MNTSSSFLGAVARTGSGLFLSAWLVSPALADVSGEGRVVEATVYRDRVLVTRALEVDLAAGSNRIEMTGLPATLDQDSLRVRGRGPDGTVLEGFETRMETAEEVESPEYLEAEAELRELESERTKWKDGLATIQSQREFLQGIKVTVPEEIGRGLTTGEVKPESWQKAFDFLGFNLKALADLQRGIQKRMPELERRIAAARARLQQIRSKGRTRTLTALVALRAPSAGKGEVRVEYLTGPASWYPIYEARYDRVREVVEFVEKGMVRQETGEDWEGIQLTLSTARPGRPLDLPEIKPLPLRGGIRSSGFLQKVPSEAEAGDNGDGNINITGALARDVLIVDSVNVGDPFTGQDPMRYAKGLAVPMTATSMVSGTVVIHRVSMPQDVPSDGQFHRYRISIQSMRPEEEELRAAPRFQEGVYLRAKVVSPADHPLLAGKVVSFDGPNLLGSSILEERAPGEEFTIPFGPDPRFRAKKQRLSRVVDSGSRLTRVNYLFLTTLESYHDDPRRLVLEDLIPISENDAIQVRLLGDTTPGYEEDPEVPGLLRWTFDLQPGEKTEIHLAYEVRYPTGWYIPNLE